MKKLLALLTSITMLISVMPVMANAEGEVTAYNAYDELVADAITYVSNSYSVNAKEHSIGVETKGSFSVNIDFGTTTPDGAVVKSAWYLPNKSMLYAKIGDEVIGVIPPYDTNGFTNWKTRYFEILKPELCTGVQTVTFSTAGCWGKFHSIEFYTQDDVTNGLSIGAPAMLTAYENFESALSWVPTLTNKTTRRYNVDFGENKDSLVFEISRTYASNTTAPAATLALADGTKIANIPAATATANVPLVQMVEVLEDNLLNGPQIVCLEGEGTYAKTYELKFIKVINPYQNLLAEGEIIGGDAYKIYNKLMFGANGTKSVDVTYTGSGSLAFAFGEYDENPVYLELPSATAQTTQTVKFEDAEYFKGYVDTLYVMDGYGTLNVTQIKFNENLLNDQFNGATEVSVHYIGEGSEWYADIKSEFETANAQDGRTFATDIIDLAEIFTTDFDKINYVKLYTTTADIVFVQAGDYAQVILDNLVAMENPPIVMIVGDAAYAENYCISAIAAGENALRNEENYRKPAEYVSTIYSDGLNLANPAEKTKNTFNWNASNGKLGALHPWPSYAKYENVNLSHGVASIAMRHYGGTSDAVVDIRLDSQTGPLLATFTQSKGLETSVQNVSKSYTGTHDVYVIVRLADNSTTTSWSLGFGDICSIVFNPAIDNTAYTTGLDLANPNSKTLYAHNYNSNSKKLGALHPWPSYSEYKSVNLYKGVSKILLKSDYLPTNDQYFEGKKGTKAVIRVGDPKTGDVLATFDQIIGWVDTPYLTREATVTGNYQGNQDIYLCIENDDPNYGKDGYYFAGFADIYSVVFVPGNVEAEEIAYTDGLNASNADINALTQINETLFLADGESVTYSKVAFGEEQLKVMKAILAATDGTLTVTSGETVIATLDLTAKSGNFENVMAVSDVNLTGTMPLTFTYAGANGCYLKGVEFVDMKAYSTKLDITNYAEIDPGIPNPEQTSGWDKLPVRLNTTVGSFESMIDNFIKWEGVDFGKEAKRATVEIGYANIAQYSGATISLYIDSIAPENKIAETIAEAHHYQWTHRVSNTELVNRYITGYHDVYLVVNPNYESGYAVAKDASANIFDVQFKEFSTEDKYYVETKEIDRSYYSTDLKKWARDIKFSKQVALSFVKDSESPASYMLIAAAYDVTTGALLGLETAKADTVDGLNVATVRLQYRDFGLGQYLFKYFVWDGETLKPLADGSDTLEVSEIVYPQ